MNLTAILIGFGSLLALVAGAFVRGRSSAKRDAKLKQAEDYTATRDKIDKALEKPGDWRDRLKR